MEATEEACKRLVCVAEVSLSIPAFEIKGLKTAEEHFQRPQ